MNIESKKAQAYLNSRLKRSIDILAGVGGLPLMLISIGLVGIATKLENRNSEVFFKQERIGRNGHPFTMYKLTTMDKGGKKTKVGSVIRPLGIDELTQTLNLLNGSMSIFGVRALTKEALDRYHNLSIENQEIFSQEFIKEWEECYFSAKPGGLSLGAARAKSVFNRGYQDSKGLKIKMEYDIEQVRNASFGMEMSIFLTIIKKALGLNKNLTAGLNS